MKGILTKFVLFLPAIILAIGLSSLSMNADQTYTGKAYQYLFFEIDTTQFDSQELDELKEAGYEIQEDGFGVTRPYVEGSIIVDGKSTEIIEGEFEVQTSSETIQVESDTGPKTVTKNEDGIFIVTEELNLNEVLDDMDNAHAEASEDLGFGIMAFNKKYSGGEWVHCNRWNGIFSDNVHYDKKVNPVKAARNFLGSDCDLALLSWRKCDKHNWCNYKGKGAAAACSTQIGHKKTFHKH